MIRGLKPCISHLTQSEKIFIPELKENLSIRPSSSDFDVFLQVFRNREYDIGFNTSIKTIIDAGANNGYTARFLSMKYPLARIFSIEPDPDNYAELEKNVKPISNITPIFGALIGGDKSKNVKLGSGKHWCRRIEVGDGEIPGYPLRSIMDHYKISRIDLLKIDIEGGEKDVFSSGTELWLDHVVNIVIELHDRWVKGTAKTFFDALSHKNYSMEVSGENVILRNIS